MNSRTFPVLEMSCAVCAARVEKIIAAQAGVEKAVVNFAAATVTVTYDDSLTSPEMLQRAVRQGGYDLVVEDGRSGTDEAEECRRKSYHRLQRRAGWAVVLAVPLIVAGMFFMHRSWSGVVTCLLATPIVFGLGRDFFTGAWKQLRHRSANMDTLVAISTGTAYFFSLFNLLFPDFWRSRGLEPHVYFEASGVVVAFILLGRMLEERAKAGTSSAIRRLMGFQPKTVTLIDEDDREQVVPIEQIRPGCLVLVRPGERVAVDGVVVGGHSYVDESMLSGEAIAVEKKPGEKVFAGTINQKGSFRFRAQEVGTGTVLSQIIRLVQEAQGSKAPVQRLVDRVAAVFVPVILSVAVLTFIIWINLSPDHGFTYGLLAAVTVMVIACPCALGLATPTAIMVGIGKGADMGILVKNAESLEMARKIDTVVLDKTGTITEGRPCVTDTVVANGGVLPAEALCSLEKLSEHPLAEAITAHLRCQTMDVENFESLSGRGVRGSIGGKLYMAGNLRLLRENGVDVGEELIERAQAFAREAKTMVWFADEKRAIALLAVSDRVKETSATAVARLKEMGLDVCMLTGDNAATAAAIARQTGIDLYEAEMLPAGKADFIKKLQADGKKVAMAGDGINDSAALAQADLGFAMGQGSDVAMDVAQITIMSSDPIRIADAIRLSAKTVRTIRQNLFWAFIYNIVSVPVAAGILYPLGGFLLNPMIAGAAMAMSSVSVVANSLRLKTWRI
ncbi:putative copper-transporting ATPase PacS [Bacteroidaceae bacterium]|nr:heavy metal translocating P-type ATPase [Prevotella sp. MGM2]GFI33677.1 putative copper-transporting ATPase PacS [Bacteroidaceae bacterium]